MVFEKARKLLRLKRKADHAGTLTDRTQPEKTGQSRKRLIIGLDFGTAFTKVVIGEGRVRYAVPFGQYAHPDNPYLLPSKLELTTDGKCRLHTGNGAATIYDELKIALIENDYKDEHLIRIAAYLALVFRVSRGWLLNQHADIYFGSQLAWMVNVGLPTFSFINKELSETYRRLIYAAWMVSVLPGPVTMSRVSQYMAADDTSLKPLPEEFKSRIIAPDLINTFPEFAAQIFGYVNSPRNRNDDLHMLIDVGAGTLDIVTFNIAGSRTGDNEYYIYSSAVEPLGVSYMLKRRYDHLALEKYDFDLFSDIPDISEFAEKYGVTAKDIEKADDSYRVEVVKLINRIMDIAKTQYYPESKRWATGVLTFSCGGGAHLKILQEMIERFENRPPPHKIQSLPLVVPDDLKADGLDVDAYDRLSVGYGLSFDPYDIGEVIPERPAGTSESAAGKRVPCPHCGGVGFCSYCQDGWLVT